MDSQTPQLIVRSKNQRSILFCYYRFVLLIFFVHMAIFIVIPFLMQGWSAVQWVLWDRYMLIAVLCSVCVTFFYAWNGKGNLVESLTIDYANREIVVQHWQLPANRCQSILPFDGLTWDVQHSFRGYDRLRLKPREGRPMVICIDHLGWTFDDYINLLTILENIVKHAI